MRSFGVVVVMVVMMVVGMSEDPGEAVGAVVLVASGPVWGSSTTIVMVWELMPTATAVLVSIKVSSMTTPWRFSFVWKWAAAAENRDLPFSRASSSCWISAAALDRIDFTNPWSRDLSADCRTGGGV